MSCFLFGGLDLGAEVRHYLAYGADVLWITASHLPSLPSFDADTARGKRTTQLDLRVGSPDREKFVALVRDADVLLQAYRPGGLGSLGFSADELLEINPDLCYATLSAYGEEGPWAWRKGFDSLVQFAVGINDAEGRAYGEYVGRAEEDFEPRKLPCQALDHASGYLLALVLFSAPLSDPELIFSSTASVSKLLSFAERPTAERSRLRILFSLQQHGYALLAEHHPPHSHSHTRWRHEKSWLRGDGWSAFRGSAERNWRV